MLQAIPGWTTFTTDDMHSKMSLTSQERQTGTCTQFHKQILTRSNILNVFIVVAFMNIMHSSITETQIKPTNLVKSACSSQDNVRVFHLNHSLSQTDQIRTDPNSATCHLQEHKQWLRKRSQRTTWTLLPQRNQVHILTILIVIISLYAWEDSPAMVPEPLRFSTPRPSSFPMMSVMMYL